MKTMNFLERGVVRVGNEAMKGRWQHVQVRRPSRSFVRCPKLMDLLGACLPPTSLRRPGTGHLCLTLRIREEREFKAIKGAQKRDQKQYNT